MTIPPGEGERRAQLGLVPQYKVAAEKVYAALVRGDLHAVGLADPEAGTLDDIQVISRRGASLVLDAYQVKWSRPGGVLRPADFAGLLAELVVGRRSVGAAQAKRQEEGAPDVARVTAHLYTSKTPSTSSRKGDAFDGRGRTLHTFIEQVWWPAQREVIGALADVDPKWHDYLASLASACGMGAPELLEAAVDLRVHVGRQLDEEAIQPEDWQKRDYLSDLVEIRSKLQDLVTDAHRTYVWISVRELLEHLGPDWTSRWHPRSDHQFPLREPYEPLKSTATALTGALDRFDQGYIVLTGSPGAGKSTLLTDHLRADPRVAARYYAYVPDNDSHSRGEASAFLHDLFLALASRRGQRGPTPRQGDIQALREGFRAQLGALGEEARREGRTEVIVIDGLDHVTRDPLPHHPFLDELPLAREVPDGVLILLGTRGLGDLPKNVRASVVGARHIEIAPLPRAAVIALAEKENLGDVAETVATLSAGHPLLARTYLAMASQLDPRGRAAALSASAPSSGEIQGFYGGVWQTVCDSPELVALLGTVSRIRGTIRLPWLLETGSAPAELQRLQSLGYLFKRSGAERWTFFHSSFREFLRAKTAELDGEPSLALHRSYHVDLARRCRGSSEQSAERFDLLFHLQESGEPASVLAAATPGFFRRQADDMRPRANIQEDIGKAALALAECQDAGGALNVALAAFELQTRRYQYPEPSDFLRLLVEIGQPELAVAHLGEIDNGTLGHDRRKSAMELTMALKRHGLAAEASRLFEMYEPLEWFGGRSPSLRQASGGERPSLWAWAEAASMVAGPAYVVETVRALRPPDGLDRQTRLTADEVVDLRCDLLWVAANHLLRNNRWEDAEIIRGELVALGSVAREEVALLDLRRLGYQADGGLRDLAAGITIDVDALPHPARIELASLYVRANRVDSARSIFDRLARVDLPQETHFDRRDRHAWRVFYSYWRLAAALGVEVDPVKAVEDPSRDYLAQTVLAARHLVAFAQLDGRSNPSLSAIEASLSRLHAYWETSAGRDDFRRPSEVRSLVTRRAIALASDLGPDATKDLFGYFKTRWSNRPAALFADSVEVIGAFADAGIGDVSIREALSNLQSRTDDSESSPDDWVELGLAWARFGDLACATICARRAVARTLSLSSDKDLQLGTWVKLIDPLLDGTDGEPLLDAFLDALIELDRISYGGSPDHAARLLIERLARRDPHRAWNAGRRLLDARVLDADDVLVALLSAGAHTPSDLWWIAISELLVVFGVDVPSESLAAAVQANAPLAVRWLPCLLERVAIEGRPSYRRSWRLAIENAAAGQGIADLPLWSHELEVGAETPARERPSDDSDGQAPLSVEDALAALENSTDGRSYEPVRTLGRRIDELTDGQVTRLLGAIVDREEEASVTAALARRALSESDVDLAWQYGLRAIATSRPGDWSRSWAGGPVLQLIPDLQEIDRERVRSAVYGRFAELAQSSDYFLGSIGGDLDQYVDALELPTVSTARSAWDIARAVLRDVAKLPDANGLDALEGSRHLEPSGWNLAVEGMIDWLLRSPYVVAWQAGQRAILAMLPEGGGRTILVEMLRCDDDGVVLRACAVIETALAAGVEFEEMEEALIPLLSNGGLRTRAAAAGCLREIGVAPPAPSQKKQLPVRLRLELPPHPGTRQIASGLRALMYGFRDEVDRLADAAGLDEDALYAYVLDLAEELGGVEVDDEALSRTGGIFGYGFVKPSALAAIAALDKAAADLVDAQTLSASRAMRAARLAPIYDVGLLASRPQRRPTGIVPFLALSDRSSMDLYKRSASELARGAEDRLLAELDGWSVIGEWTELALLDRLRHYERRVSAVTCGVEDSIDDYGQTLIEPCSTRAYRRLRPSGRSNGRTILRPGLTTMASPDGWLALHPDAAADLGLAADQDSPLDWRLGGEPAVRSVQWRSGYDRWSPYSETDEVGEGWVVLASWPVIERLNERGTLLRVGNTWSGRHGDGHTPAVEKHSEVIADLDPRGRQV